MSRRKKWGCSDHLGCGCLGLLILLGIMGWAFERWGEISGWIIGICLGLIFLCAFVVNIASPRQRQGLRAAWYRGFGEGRQPIPQWMREEILKRDDYRCRYCGRRAQTLDIDHVIPVSQGGKTVFSNLVTACSACNRKKAGCTPLQAGMRVRRI